MLMKQKLISLVRPIPSTALQAENLESFRAHLYTAECPEFLPLQPTDDTVSILSGACCSWCGTWMPLPRQAIIAIDSFPNTEASEATAAEEEEETLDAHDPTTIITTVVKEIISADIQRTGKDDSEDLGFKIIDIGAIPPELSNFDYFEYLAGSPMLCEVVCLMWGGGDKAQEKYLRAQKVAALRARWVGRKDNEFLPWLSSPHVSASGQYATDPNTGECKTQWYNIYLPITFYYYIYTYTFTNLPTCAPKGHAQHTAAT